MTKVGYGASGPGTPAAARAVLPRPDQDRDLETGSPHDEGDDAEMSTRTDRSEPVGTGTRAPAAAWAGYAACGWGLIFAAISFYWGSGGRTLLDTIGGSIERMALAGDTSIYVAVWVTGLLKMVGAVLALALVQPWGRRLPRRLVALLGWVAAIFLTLYGGLLVLGDALVAVGVVKQSQPIVWKPLWWHLWVWDMSFFIWGLLFAVALWSFRRSVRRPR